MPTLNPIPDSCSISARDGNLVLVRRWLRPLAWFYLLIALFWCGFMITIWTVILNGNAGKEAPPTLFLLPHTLVGLFLACYVLALFLNRTEIQVTASQLRIDHGPIPWRGSRDFARANVQQIFADISTWFGRSPSYRVCVVTDEGRKVTLVNGPMQREEAVYLAHELRARLALPEDTRVAGELR